MSRLSAVSRAVMHGLTGRGAVPAPVRNAARSADAGRVLAWASLRGPGWAVGTSRALLLGQDPQSMNLVQWHQIHHSSYDAQRDAFVLFLVAQAGTAMPRVQLAFAEPQKSETLLQLIKERVTASILVDRHLEVRGGKGVRLVARRTPGGVGEPEWTVEPDSGIDLDDPQIRELVRVAVADAQESLEASR